MQQHISLHNDMSILTDAIFYNALPLVRSVQGYMARNLETLPEQRTLENLPADLIKQLSAFIREEQRHKSLFSRSGALIEEKMCRWCK
jgi:inhibitor of Bruton tyrosine kinase